MTVDHHSQTDKKSDGSLLQTLTIVFAGLTVLFAVISIVFSNRVSTIHTYQLQALENSSASESTSVSDMQTAIKDAQANLEIAKQETLAERKNTNRLIQQLEATQKELEKTKAELNAANQIIAARKTQQPEKPLTSVDTALPGDGTAASSQPPALPQGVPTPKETVQSPVQRSAPGGPVAEPPSDGSVQKAPGSTNPSSRSLPPATGDQETAPNPPSAGEISRPSLSTPPAQTDKVQ